MLGLHLRLSYTDEVIKDIYIRGIASRNLEIPVVIIEEPSSGSLKAYRLHELVNGYEIVEIQKEGILLKKGDKVVRVLLSNRDSFAHEDEEYQEEELQIFTFQMDQIVTEKLSDQILTKPVPDVEKKDYRAAGVTVIDIEEGNFMNIMGLEPGDILLDFYNTPISKPEDLEEAIKKVFTVESGMISMGFERNGKYKTSYAELK